jgi:hypothetical protein
MPKLPSCRRCCCGNCRAGAPGDVPVMTAGLRFQEFWPRAPQSIAFFTKLGIEPLCSGVRNKQALRRHSLRLDPGRRSSARQVIDLDKTKANLSAPSSLSARARRRLTDFAAITAER